MKTCRSRLAVCLVLPQHAPHCSAVAPAEHAQAGFPCVRDFEHAGDVHAYGLPNGTITLAPAAQWTGGEAPAPWPVRGQICGECGQRWPGHKFECPEYQKHGTGAPPAPRRRRVVRPGVSYASAVCKTCGAASGDPCVGLRYDQVHPSRFIEIEDAHAAAASSKDASAATQPQDWDTTATTSMENVAHLIGVLAGMDRRLPLLVEHLENVKGGTSGFANPIGLPLSVGEVLDFLRALEPVMKAAIRLHDLALTREAAPEEKRGTP